MDNEKISKSLFDDDVRHSIESVELRWAREKERRRRLMLKLSPILVIIIIGCYLGVARYCRIFPFSLEKQYAEEERLREENEKKEVPSRTMGFEEAKLKIKVVLEELFIMDQDWSDVFDALIDAKPSEAYIEIWLYKKLPAAEKAKFHENVTSMTINGQNKITYLNEKGEKKEAITNGQSEFSCNALTLANIFNQAYMDTYGSTEKPIDLTPFLDEIKQAEEYHKKNALPELILPKDTQPAKEAEAKKVKIDTAGGDPITLPKLEMKLGE